MDFKGTKGKWIIDEEEFFINDSGVDVFSISNECKTEVQMADVYGSKANAMLISKAPEMLEMLDNIKDYLGSDVRARVEQLIKEATDL